MDGVIAGAVDVTVYFRLRDSATGLPKTGLAYNSAGAVCRYTRVRGAATAITLADLLAVNSAHGDGGFKEVDAANAPGLYRLDLPDAACASGSRVVEVSLKFTGVIPETKEIALLGGTQGWGSAASAAEAVFKGPKKLSIDRTAGTKTVYAEDGTTVLATRTVAAGGTPVGAVVEETR